MYSCSFNSAEPLQVTQPLPLPASVSLNSNFPHNASITIESQLSWAHLQPVLCGLNLSPFSLDQIVFCECAFPIVYHLPDLYPSFSGEARPTPHFLRGSQIMYPSFSEVTPALPLLRGSQTCTPASKEKSDLSLTFSGEVGLLV